jgi:hypothetical protein
VADSRRLLTAKSGHTFQRSGSGARGFIRLQPAMTGQSGFFSIAAIHFYARLEAVIAPGVLRFLAWEARVQRKQTDIRPRSKRS